MNMQMVTLEQLEREFAESLIRLQEHSQAVIAAWQNMGRILFTMRGNEAYEPWRDSGKHSWRDYIVDNLEVKYGVTYQRILQVLAAYEAQTEISDLLNNVERRAAIQQKANELGIKLPDVLPVTEAPYRALAGVPTEDKAMILAVAQQGADTDTPTFNDVARAKRAYTSLNEQGKQPTATNVNAEAALIDVKREIDRLTLEQLADIKSYIERVIEVKYATIPIEA